MDEESTESQLQEHSEEEASSSHIRGCEVGDSRDEINELVVGADLFSEELTEETELTLFFRELSFDSFFDQFVN